MRSSTRVAVAVWFVLISSAMAASAATISSWTLTDCDDQGCEGAMISLTVEELPGDYLYRVTQGLNLTMYDSGSETPMTTIQAIDWKALKDVVEIHSFTAPGGDWDASLIDSNTTGAGCGGSGNDKVCTQESNGGVDFDDLATDADGWSYWVYIVEAGGVLPVLDQSYGLDYGPARGRLISASVPEPSALLVFGVGFGAVLPALRRRRA